MKKIRSRFNIPPLSESYEEISRWFASPLGRRLLIQERKAVAEELKYLFGYHFMALSSVKTANFANSCRINHCFSFAPDAESTTCTGVSNFDELPIGDEMVDVTVLHHVLEFSKNPHQVLKEAARVTIPRGYLIIVAFNPMSLAGLMQPVSALFGAKGVSRRRALPAQRMLDWLEFLDFTCTDSRHLFRNLPINNKRYLASTSFLERLGAKNSLPGGMSYVIVARKDKVGVTPLRPQWESKDILSAIPVPKQAIRSRPRKSGIVLPFRNRIKGET